MSVKSIDVTNENIWTKKLWKLRTSTASPRGLHVEKSKYPFVWATRNKKMQFFSAVVSATRLCICQDTEFHISNY